MQQCAQLGTASGTVMCVSGKVAVSFFRAWSAEGVGAGAGRARVD